MLPYPTPYFLFRLCVESILEKLPDKSYLKSFKEASDPDEAQHSFKPLTNVRYLPTLGFLTPSNATMASRS